MAAAGKKDSTPTTTRKDPTVTENEEPWTCTICKNIFKLATAEMMECEFCSEHMCRKCLGITKADYTVMAKRTDAHWFCPQCEKKAMNNIKAERIIEERCKAFMQKMEERVCKLEHDISTRPNKLEVEEIVERKLSNLNAEVNKTIEEKVAAIHIPLEEKTSATTDENLEEKVQELMEWEARKNNIVIYNLAEPTKTDADSRKEEDKKEIADLCYYLGSDPGDIITTIRLGRKSQDEAEKRPLKVIFTSEKPKGIILRNASRLQQVEGILKGISITHDMSKKEREKNKQLHLEAKRMNEEKGEEDVNHIYKVRGPPWDRKVGRLKIKTK